MPENEVKLLPCRECGNACRIESFGGSHIIGVMDLYMCVNGPKFGGDCLDPHAYLSAAAWNTRPTVLPCDDELVERVRKALEGIERIAEKNTGVSGSRTLQAAMHAISHAAKAAIEAMSRPTVVTGEHQNEGAIPGSREPDPSFTGSGPPGFDPERGA